MTKISINHIISYPFPFNDESEEHHARNQSRTQTSTQHKDPTQLQ